MEDKRSVVLIVSDLMGISMAYSLTNITEINELILIDIGNESMQEKISPMSDQFICVNNHIKITMGTYEDCVRASIVIIAAGLQQQQRQTRLELTEVNAAIMKNITIQIMSSGFDGIMIVASQPVDLMTYVVQKVSHLPSHQVIGTGTLLDTDRLRYKLSQLLKVSPQYIHAYVLGEHGDSSFVSWSNCYIGCMSIKDYLDDHGISECQFDKVLKEVKDVNNHAFKRNSHMCFETGLSFQLVIKSILNDQNAIFSVSCQQNDEYNDYPIYIAMPAIINKNGVKEIQTLRLEDTEKYKLEKVCQQLSEIIETIINPIL